MKNSKILIVITIVFVFVVSMFGINLELENRGLKTIIKNQQNQINTLQDEITSFSLENHLLMEENKKLTKENKDLIQVFNGKLEELKKEATIGTSKPKIVGFGPQWTLVSRGGFDRYQRKINLDNLTQGSYQYQKEEISFDINDMNSWPDLGNWYVSCYTATVGECDSDPSTTSSGTLVTPSFTVAVDPDFWQFGTIFYFEGLGFGIAADSGGFVQGKNRADFLVASKTFAKAMDGDRHVYLVYTPPN